MDHREDMASSAASHPRVLSCDRGGGFGGKLVIAALLMLLALPLASCGKKGSPTPPPGTVVTYPRSYPHD
jgi:predicted small lipoprotein YifL